MFKDAAAMVRGYITEHGGGIVPHHETVQCLSEQGACRISDAVKMKVKQETLRIQAVRLCSLDVAAIGKDAIKELESLVKTEGSGRSGMSEFVIKPMETEDEINGKGYVHYKSWQETYAGLVDAGYLDSHTLEKTVKTAHRWLDNILVAKDGDRVIGFVGYGAYRDDTIPGHGEIFALYVLKDYHGKRVGYGLMNAAFEKLAAYKKVAVWVLKGNDRAIRFYERYGFHFDGTEAEIMLGTPNTELRMIYGRAADV